MSQYPEPVVGAFTRNQKGELLLVKSHKWGDQWVVPGGHIELGESIEDALEREVKEEVGIEIENPRIIIVFESIFPEDFHEKKHFIFIQCECYIKANQTIKLDNTEIQESKWLTLENWLNEPLHEKVRKTIEILKNEEE